MKIIAIYPGRFQPFGKHHAEAFNWLMQQFGEKNSYIVTSDSVKLPKSPLSFKDKKEVISKYGLGKNVVKVKNPYAAEELTSKFDPKTTAVVFMVGQKDMEEDPRFQLKPSGYFRKYDKNKKLDGYDKHGYLIVAPHVSLNVPGYGEMSGTSIRNAIANAKTSPQRKELFKKLFGWYDAGLAKLLHDKFSQKNVSEGYMSPKQAEAHKQKLDKLQDFLDKNHGRPFVYDFDMFPKTVYGVKIDEMTNKTFWDNFFQLVMEGGAGGHMAHPFDIPTVTTGNDLINVFKQSIEYLTKKPASVKIDGVNASIRLVPINNKRTFVMDRGSNKPLDVKGITKAELTSRFGEGHGMIKVGGTVLDIFNDAMPTIQSELKQLGLWDNPNIMFNIEYVAGSTNVLSYEKNFLAIHGLLEIQQVTPTRRSTSEITYNKTAMQRLLNKLNPIAQNYGYEVLGSVPTTLEGQPDLNKELNTRYTVNYGTKKETKTLKQWLASAKIPQANIKTVDGKSINALSKEVLIKISEGMPLNKFIADKKDYQAAIDGYVIYMATMKLGDAVLEKLTSPLGPVAEHEGIVIRDPKIYNKPFKITGKFILGGLATSFRK